MDKGAWQVIVLLSYNFLCTKFLVQLHELLICYKSMEFIWGRDQRIEGFFHTTWKCHIDNTVSETYHLEQDVVWLNPDQERRQRLSQLWHILWEGTASQVACPWGWSQEQGEMSVGCAFIVVSVRRTRWHRANRLALVSLTNFSRFWNVETDPGCLIRVPAWAFLGGVVCPEVCKSWGQWVEWWLHGCSRRRMTNSQSLLKFMSI